MFKKKQVRNKYALREGGEERLELIFGQGKDPLRVLLDGNEIAEYSKEEFKTGKEVTLPDGGVFKLRNKGGLFPQLSLTLDGKDLPGSPGDVKVQAKNAGNLIYFLGGLGVAFGMLAFIMEIEFFRRLGLGIESAIFGGVFCLLGFFVREKYSIIALGIAIVIYVTDSVFTVITMARVSGNPGGNIMFRLLIFAMLGNAFLVMWRNRDN